MGEKGLIPRLFSHYKENSYSVGFQSRLGDVSSHNGSNSKRLLGLTGVHRKFPAKKLRVFIIVVEHLKPIPGRFMLEFSEDLRILHIPLQVPISCGVHGSV